MLELGRLFVGALGVADQAGVPPFEIDNRGKKSVVLDLRDEGDLATMHGLLAEADVFVSNVRRAGLARMGLDPATLTERYPRLVYGLLTGYGSNGPDVDRAGYDIGARLAMSLPALPFFLRGHHTPSFGGLFGAAAAAGAMMRLDATRMRYHLSYTAQQASGIASWQRDTDHIEKSFDFGGMAARNGVTVNSKLLRVARNVVGN